MKHCQQHSKHMGRHILLASSVNHYSLIALPSIADSPICSCRETSQGGELTAQASTRDKYCGGLSLFIVWVRCIVFSLLCGAIKICCVLLSAPRIFAWMSMVMECGQRVKIGEGDLSPDLSTLGALALGYHDQHMYITLAVWHVS